MGTKLSRIFLFVLATLGGIVVVSTIAFGVFISYVVHSFSTSAKDISTSFTRMNSSQSQNNFVMPSANSPYIAGVKLKGEITSSSADEVIEKLNAAKNDKNAVGVLLDVSSPGGSVVPSQEIYDIVKEVRTKKPVVVFVREMAASGAYYSSASANKIIANRASLIGSIGVIINGFEAEKLIQFLKVSPITIKTGELKDAGSFTRPMTNKDREYLKKLIEATYNEFASDVQSGRQTTAATMKYMSDGRVVLAPEALSLHLIDSIGTRQLALDEISKIAKIKQTPELFYYENTQPFNIVLSKKFLGSISQVLSQTILEVLKSSQDDLRVPKI